jgi:hypothetical protein
MAALHEHGLVWKDAQPGVWLASTELFGRKAFAYAIELYDRATGFIGREPTMAASCLTAFAITLGRLRNLQNLAACRCSFSSLASE